jgi:prevent-host-death family protein
MGYIKPMSATLRVPTATFKSNMRPFIEEARAGKDVIVTNDGADDFRVVPLGYVGSPPVAEKPIKPETYKGINVNEPAFASWE